MVRRARTMHETVSYERSSPYVSAFPKAKRASGRRTCATRSIQGEVSTPSAPCEVEKPVPQPRSKTVAPGGNSVSFCRTADRTSTPEYDRRSITYVASGANVAWNQPRKPRWPQLWMRGSYQYT